MNIVWTINMKPVKYNSDQRTLHAKISRKKSYVRNSTGWPKTCLMYLETKYTFSLNPKNDCHLKQKVNKKKY